MRRILVSLALVAALTGARATPASALTVAEWAKALSNPALGGAGIDAAGRTLTYGHLRLRLLSGRLYPVVVADRVVGVFFAGEGQFRYTCEDPLMMAAYRTNVERDSSYKVDKDGAIGDGITEALVWLSDGADATVEGQAWREGTPPAGLLERHLERFGNDDARLAVQMLPLAILDPQPKATVVAEIVAAKHDLRFTVDPFRDHDEWIDVMKAYRTSASYYNVPYFKDRRYVETLCDQLIDHGWLEPTPLRFLLRSLDVTVVNPRDLRAELEATETFEALVPVRVLDLGLWSTRFGAASAGLSGQGHPYLIDSINLVGGGPLPFSHVNNELLVELPTTLQPGQRVTVRAHISGDVLFHPGGDSYWELPTSSWFPSPVRLEAQYMTYHAVVKVKKPFVAFSCGKTMRRWEEGDLACAEFREDKPIQIPVVLAGKYTTYSDERNGLTVRVSSYATADKRAANKLANLAFTFIDFYRPFLGDYPFAELNVIEINSVGFGQAPPGVIFITKEAFTPGQDELTMAYSRGVNARFAHEIAHAWWGHVAKLDMQDQWLSESVAEYYSAYALGKLWKASVFKQKVGEWRGESKFVRDKASVFMANRLSGNRAWEDRVALLYGKGPLVLDALRKQLGDNAFFTIFKSFLHTYSFKVAQTRNFIALTNYIAKKDYTEWFDRYLLGTDWP
jgi:hypothetical protein